MSQFATFVSATSLASLLVVSGSVQAQSAASAAPTNPAAAPAAETVPQAAPVEAAPAPAPAPVAAPVPTRRELRYLPRRMNYHGEPIPEEYVLQSSSRRGLVIGGAAVLGAPYIIGLVFSGASGFANQGGWLGVPVAGPFLTYSLRRDCWSHSCSSIEDGANNALKTLLLLDGVVQAAGATMLILGFVLQKEELVRKDLANVWFAPTLMGKGGYGLAAVGRF